MTVFEKKLIQKKLGLMIRDFRLKRNYTLRELAIASNLHYTYVHSVELGHRNISLINICKLANALKCTPSEIMQLIF